MDKKGAKYDDKATTAVPGLHSTTTDYSVAKRMPTKEEKIAVVKATMERLMQEVDALPPSTRSVWDNMLMHEEPMEVYLSAPKSERIRLAKLSLHQLLSESASDHDCDAEKDSEEQDNEYTAKTLERGLDSAHASGVDVVQKRERSTEPSETEQSIGSEPPPESSSIPLIDRDNTAGSLTVKRKGSFFRFNFIGPERKTNIHIPSNAAVPTEDSSKYELKRKTIGTQSIPISSNEIDENSSRHIESITERRSTILQNIVDDFTPKGDQKILRALGRTATVNAAVLVTAATGGAAGAIGYLTGGAITAKRLSDGIIQKDDAEVAKSVAVYGCATGASIAGQAITGAIMIGVAGASLPVAGAVAFGVGCASGVTAGALSEWGVDSIMEKVKFGKRRGKGDLNKCQSSIALSDDSSFDGEVMKRSESCKF